MCLALGTMVHLLRVCHFHIPYAHFNPNIGLFCIQILCSLSFFLLLHFQNSHVTLHAHTHIFIFTSTPDLIDNNFAIAIYDFENPIYQDEEEGDEYCEILGELARLLLQEEKVIQPHEESIEVINLGTDANKREVKIGANLEGCV